MAYEGECCAQAYPLVLTGLAQAVCVVIGGGAVAERKVADLIAGGACPLVISPTLTPALEELAREGRLKVIRRRFAVGDVRGALLVIAATSDGAVNRQVAEEARRCGVLVNVADEGGAGNFHTVASVRRGDLLLTVSTGGASPTLAAALCRELAAQYGPEYGRLLALLRRLRTGPARSLTPERRQLLWRRLLAGPVLGWLRGGDIPQAERYTQDQLDDLLRSSSITEKNNV